VEEVRKRLEHINYMDTTEGLVVVFLFTLLSRMANSDDYFV